MIRITGGGEPPTATMEIVDVTPEEAARNLERLARSRKNRHWFAQHAVRIGRENAGHYICVAGEELFVGSDPSEVHERAKAAHPGDREAIFSKYILPERGVAQDAN